MTICIVRKTSTGLEICTDTGAWRGESVRKDFNKIFEDKNLIFAGAGHWDVIRTLEGFIKSKALKLSNTIDVLTMLKEFNDLVNSLPSKEGYEKTDFIIYDKSTHKLFMVDNFSFVEELEENKVEIIGSCHDMAFILLQQGKAIKETVEILLENSTNVAGNANHKVFYHALPTLG